MQTLGAKLRSIRESKGITLEEAHKKTKLSINVLRALEEDNFANFSPIYIKGFLKIYAKFLAVDANSFLQEYNKLISKQQTVGEVKKDTLQVKNASSGSLNLKLNFPRISPNVRIYILRIVLAFILVFVIVFGINLLKNLLSKIPKAFATKKMALIKPKGLKEEIAKEIVKTKNSSAKNTTEQTKQAVAARQEENSLVRIGLKARRDTWIQVKVDAKVVYQGTLRKGSVESWQAKNKIILSVHNANDIDLSFQDKQLYPLSHKRQAMKNIVFTKEGMSSQ